MTRWPDGQMTRLRDEVMIQGSQTWQLALAQPQKQALYTVEIPDFSIAIASFSAAAVPTPSLGGYGVTLYGVGLYGT